MADLTPMLLRPGNWMLPMTKYQGIAPCERQDVVIMVFEAEHGEGAERVGVSLKTPISKDCAAQLLQDLLVIQAASPLDAEWA
jgi:hypothetical protein